MRECAPLPTTGAVTAGRPIGGAMTMMRWPTTSRRYSTISIFKDVTLVAHSGAGGEAIRYIARYGADRLARLVLVGATGPTVMAQGEAEGVTPDMLDALCGQLATNLSGWIDDNIEAFAPGTPHRVNEWMASMVLDCSRRAVVAFQRTIAEADLSAEAASLALPVTIIHGDRDVSAPIDASARRFASIIPKADLVVYEDVAHGVMVTHAGPARRRNC